VRLVLCAAEIPDRYSLTLPRGIAVNYEQRLRHCGVGDNRPGLHMAVAAGTTAANGELVITGTESDSPVCDPIPVTVTDPGPASAEVRPPEPAWLSDMDEADARFVSVNGIRTRYFDKGAGEVLLLVHGRQPSSMDGTAWDWQQNFAALAKHFHVYALDRIGQGYTDNPADLDDYKDYYPLVVRHVLGFMEAVGIRRAHLVGHSQGSWPVTRIAIDHPARVASLTLVDGTMGSPLGSAPSGRSTASP
jgi:hypothetical protein